VKVLDLKVGYLFHQMIMFYFRDGECSMKKFSVGFS